MGVLASSSSTTEYSFSEAAQGFPLTAVILEVRLKVLCLHLDPLTTDDPECLDEQCCFRFGILHSFSSTMEQLAMYLDEAFERGHRASLLYSSGKLFFKLCKNNSEDTYVT